MGKIEQCEDSRELEKVPLRKYLPHRAYTIKRSKLISKQTKKSTQFINLKKEQICSAVKCLKKFAEENENPTDLIGEKGFIFLQVDTSKIPEEHSIRPVQIKLPHPIYSPEFKSRFTIFVSNPEDTFIEKIENLNLPTISDAIGYQKMKKNFKQLKDKRSLLASNDLFFCDWKIYNLLRQPLGKLFYERKKFPFPIDCERVPEECESTYANYEQYLNGLGDYTYFMMGNGPVYTIKIGRTSMNNKQLVKNIIHGAYKLVGNIIGDDVDIEHIRQISIKTYNSPSLPIYNHLTKDELAKYIKTQK